MPDLVLYTTADTGLLVIIFNAIASICNNGTMVWGFAMMVSTWMLIVMQVRRTTAAFTGNTSALPSGSFTIGLALVFAVLLTSNGSKAPIKIQSLTTGTLTQVDNVPILLSIAPATVSVMAKNMGETIKTAFQSSGTDYSSISASNGGFINPLKSLLMSRAALFRLSGVQQQVRILMSSCVDTNLNVNFSALSARVLNAGNTGATTAQSIPVHTSAGALPTSLGALLSQAASNSTGYVPELDSGGGAVLLSCSDAATYVAANVQAALDSVEFQRVAQGSVNSIDSPNIATDYSFSKLSQTYAAIRTAKSGLTVLKDGAEQANAELITLMSADIVGSELQCLNADSGNKTACMAQAIQTAEIERNNLQSAASANASLKYLGQFSNYVLALIIGLSPIIVMFMMFTGLGAYRTGLSAVHMLVWPILAMNVGAEVINAIMNWEVANFMESIAKQGYLTQAIASEVYKALSLKIGTASQLMASLPILMTTIFALGQNSATTHVATNTAPKTTDAGSSGAPKPTETAPLLRQNSMATADQFAKGSQLAMAGAMSFGSNAQVDLAKAISRDQNRSLTDQETISEGNTLAENFARAFKTGDTITSGTTSGLTKALTTAYKKAETATDSTTTGTTLAQDRSNVNHTEIGAQAQAAISTPGGGGGGSKSGGLSTSAGVNGKTSTGATDALRAGNTISTANGLVNAAVLEQAIGDTIQQAAQNGLSHADVKELSRMQSVVKNFQKLNTGTKTATDSSSDTLKAGETFVSSSGVDRQQIEDGIGRKPFSEFSSIEGQRFDANPISQQYVQQAHDDIQNRDIPGSSNPIANNAIARHVAATRMFRDGTLPNAQRASALKYLADETLALNGIRPSADQPAKLPEMVDVGAIQKPKDPTSIQPEKLIKDANRAGGKYSDIPSPSAKPSTATAKARVSAPQSKAAQAIPETPTLNSNLGDALKLNVATKVVEGEYAAHDAKKTQSETLEQSGLKKDGHGTIIRAGANLANNLNPLPNADHRFDIVPSKPNDKNDAKPNSQNRPRAGQ